MGEETTSKVNISVRDLVEFILREGDIDNRGGFAGDASVMHEGSRIHRKLQKAMGSGYSAEVQLKSERLVSEAGEEFLLVVEGRADGIFTEDSVTYIDEIKTTYRDVTLMEKPVNVHRAQALCYAYMNAAETATDETVLGIRMTYCRQESETVRYFHETISFGEVRGFFDKLIADYARWAAWEIKWERERNASILASAFPFEYRPGQRDLVAAVYKSIGRGKNLFLEAPTGVGKTVSTVFPTVRLLGEGKIKKIFYGTAKTIARTVAEDTFGMLIARGMKLRFVTITSKEKLCVLDEPQCNPDACPRARGHFDRVNDAVFAMLNEETTIDRQTIERYAEKFMVCPFEMCLDVSTWADAIICDYNYIFDPTVRLKRFFADEKKKAYGFLIDEAHNLVERAREMFSACIVKEQVLAAKQAAKGNKKLENVLEAINKLLLGMKRECDEFEIWEDCASVAMQLVRFTGIYEDESKHMKPDTGEALTDLYFEARHFLDMHDSMGDDYMIYTDYDEEKHFRLKLQCMDPSTRLKGCLDKALGAVFFSATLLPVLYYRDQLGGTEEDYCVYAPSPFDTGKRLLMVAGDVSTKYTRRTDDEYRRIADYLCTFTTARRGNYMIFFPSYSMMERVAEEAHDRIGGILVQKRSMTEQEKEEFLDAFSEKPDSGVVGFCVMGGIFSEGIDLRNDRLIGVAVVGTGLPQVCNERELFRGYYDGRCGMGFEYAYLYGGMNKVLQAAGRVIRTMDDVGAILLLDERFTSQQYSSLFPREWSDRRIVDKNTVGRVLDDFWSNYR